MRPGKIGYRVAVKSPIFVGVDTEYSGNFTVLEEEPQLEQLEG